MKKFLSSLVIAFFALTALAHAQVFISNDMNGTSGADLSTYTPAVGGAWVRNTAITTGTGNILFGATSPNDIYTANAPSGSGTQLIYTSAASLAPGQNFTIDSAINQDVNVVFGNAIGFYRVGLTRNGSTWYVGINARGSNVGDVTLATYAGDNTSQTITAGTTYHLKVQYTASTGYIQLFWNGSPTALTTATDTEIQGITYVGVGFFENSTSTTGLHLKNFVATYVPATSYTLSGPVTGPSGGQTTFTIAPNGSSSGTITPAVSGITGTFSPSSITLGTAASYTFTFTPSSLGTATISTTNSAGLTDPSSVTFTSGPYAPTLTPGTGYQTLPATVAIASATSGASIYYTTNATTPTTSSTLYSGPISVGTAIQSSPVTV